MKILKQSVLALFFFSTATSHTTDDDLFKGTGVFGTDNPTKSPTLTASHTAQPTLKPSPRPTTSPTTSPRPSPTTSPTPSPTTSPTTSPTPSPTPSPTRGPSPIPTAKPSAKPITLSPSRNRSVPTKEVLVTTPPASQQKVTKSPTNSPTEFCKLSGNAIFGSQTSDKIILQYYYKMTYKSVSDPNSLVADLDSDIVNAIITNSNLFPGCNAAQNLESRVGTGQVIGISSSPNDRINSFCNGECVVVEGRLALYLSPEDRRRISIADDEIEDVQFSIKDAISNGELLAANPDILTLTYLEPGDPLIEKDDFDAGMGPSGERFQEKPVGGDIPTYGYALLATSATMSIAVIGVAVRRRRNGNNIDNTASDREALSPRKGLSGSSSDEEHLMALADDGSSIFLDTSGISKLFMAWKDMNRSRT